MPKAVQLDTYESQTLALPYDNVTNLLDPKPRFVNGANSWATFGGTLKKRLGTLFLGYTPAPNTFIQFSNLRPDRVLLYETLDSPALIYLIMSVKNTSGSTWAMYYMNLDVNNSLTSMGSLRQLNASTAPHVFTVSRGKVYIKGFPSAASGETLGTCIFDGTAGANTVTIWGVLGPTVPAHMSNQFAVGDAQRFVWNASSNPVTVNIGWQYTYAYETLDGTVSNRAPFETNPKLPASNTGPFTNLKPSIVLQGNADTTNIPFIRIYRTMDGGGTAFQVDRIANPGAGLFRYDDATQPSYPGALGFLSAPQTTTLNGAITATATTLTVSADFATPESTVFAARLDTSEVVYVTAKSGVGNVTWTIQRGKQGTVPVAHATSATVTDVGFLNDPIADTTIDTTQVAPSLTSNSPPPAVVAPQITGVATPARSTPLVTFAGRIWYAIGNNLYFSGLEEILAGVPEGAWPSGTFGNFFRFPHPVVTLFSTSDVLYIFTTHSTYWLRGTTRDSFAPNTLFSDIGAAIGHPLAVASFDRAILWLTNDYRIAYFRPTFLSVVQRQFITDPIGADLENFQNLYGAGNSEFQFIRYGEADREWLIVHATPQGGPFSSKQWVFDLKLSQWNCPWLIPTSTFAAGQVAASLPQPKLLTFNYTQGQTFGILANVDFSGATGTDAVPAAGPAVAAQQYGMFALMNLMYNPPGNHLNALRRPGQTSVIGAIRLDRNIFTGDTDPLVVVFIDNTTLSGGIPINTPITAPPRRPQSVGYRTLLYNAGLNKVAERVALEINPGTTATPFEAYTFAFMWEPDGGA